VALRRALRARPTLLEAEQTQARGLLTVSIAISGARCVLTYLLVPALSPLIQPTLGNNPRLTMPLSALALVFDIQAVRRLWSANHRLKWKLASLYAVLIVGIIGLLAEDIVRLAT
jgi:hypothetical protein